MYEENDWGHNVEGDLDESPVVCVCRDDGVQMLNEMITGKAPVAAIRGVRIQVMAEICWSPRWICNAS